MEKEINILIAHIKDNVLEHSNLSDYEVLKITMIELDYEPIHILRSMNIKELLEHYIEVCKNRI